jgi:hypothetical protein
VFQVLQALQLLQQVMTDIPSFEVAVNGMREFLRNHSGLIEPIQWVFREDIIRYGRRIFAKLPLDPLNPERSREFYEKNIGGEYGVRIVCDFIIDATPYCYVWIPSDEDVDTGCLFRQNDCGMTISEPLKNAVPVRSWLKAGFLKLLGNEKEERFNMEKLPSRSF